MSNNLQLAFKITGMDCAEEVALLKHALQDLVNAEEQLAFDILNAKMLVQTNVPEKEREELKNAIIAAVARTGMTAEVWQERPQEHSENQSFWKQHLRTLQTFACGLFVLAGFLAHVWQAGSVRSALGLEELGTAAGTPPIAMGLYIVSIVIGVWFIVPKAWRSAIRMRPDMNLLMTIAILGAALIGEWLEGATVAFLFSVSLLLESWSVGRARRAIATLMDLSPPFARVRDSHGHEKEISPAEVSVGTVFYVRPGEKIPLDGKVRAGESDINQAPITGESVPVAKSIGSEVFAGTINGDGSLEIESTKVAADTTLAQIIRMVGEAQSRRAPSEQWVEKFARVYTPIVMLLATAILLVPPLLFGGAWYDWFYRSLVLLVIACPCALVISTPVSIVAGLASAARNGVLIKGGLYLEIPARLKALAMDKTGTLTEGAPAVVDIVPMNGHNETELLQRAAALESHSNHPLAKAIVQKAAERNVTLTKADSFEMIPGKGARGSFLGKEFWLGSHRFLEERAQETPDVHSQLEAMQQAGRTVVVVGTDDHVCGFITLADKLRPDALQALKQLQAEGIEHCVMLTGDNQGTAEAIAAEAGIDEVYAELLPADKVDAIESLVKKYEHVGMIGDGVNDSPALARATLGIAMGAAGSDAAIETADIALMSDDLSKLPWLIAHSRRTLAIIRQNITFALGVKALFIVLTFAGFASLWAAIAADTGASLLVTFNGLRLLRGK